MKDFNHIPHQTKPAFTMLELIFVIVLLGILASLAVPRLDRDRKQESADNILADIRYTQHLAVTDFKHVFNDPTWQRAFWRIGFGNCASGTGLYEYIGSDDDLEGNIADNESATDPANGKKMIWSGTNKCSNGGDSNTSDRIFITHKYGINTFSMSDGCNADNANQYIGFDHLGRPHSGFTNSDTPDYSSYLNSTCTITFTMYDSTTFSINIEPETGYAYISDQEDS